MSFDMDDMLRDVRQDGYEEGCADGYTKALQDLSEVLEDPDLDRGDIMAECRRAVKKGSFA